ncbi:MAG: SLBB domain-containing protein [Candidatus Zixiibacteriota bacterium]
MRLFFILAVTVLYGGAPLLAQPVDNIDSLASLNNYRYYDQPVDPDKYLFRPGEKLIITFIKTKLPSLWLQVNPEGKLIDQNLGVFELAGKTLSEVRVVLYPPLRNLYNVEDIDITVREPYQVGVTVAGEVVKPDIYVGYTSNLVSELVAMAGGVTERGSTRRIVFSGGGKEQKIDLDRVRFLGDNSYNPCLYAGYRLFVPAKSRDLVQVTGEVNTPRAIEYLPGDNLALLLALAGGVTSRADLDAVYCANDPDKDLISEGQIAPGDVIIVPAGERGSDQYELTVFGEVNRPGIFAMPSGVTLAELLQKAGGLTEDANPENVTVFRRINKALRNKGGDTRYALNRNSVESGAFDSFILKEADSVFVPMKLGYVKVSGYVQRPGYFPLVSDKDAQFYIDQAGGFLNNANRHQIKIYDRISTISRTTSASAIVRDGDELIIEVSETRP